MKEIQKKKIIVTILGAILLSIFFLWGIKAHIVNCFRQSLFEQNVSEQVVGEKNIKHEGYDIEGDNYVSTDEDPKLELTLNNVNVAEITIEFDQEIQQNLNTQIYYNRNNLGYSEEASIKTTIEKGTKKSKIILYQKNITSLRIDIGDQKNVNFNLKKIVINDTKEKISLLQKVKNNMAQIQWGRFFCQWEILCLTLIFLGMHFVFHIKEMYDWLFRKRWIVAGLLLLFLVANKFHGESIAVYNQIIQPNESSEFSTPIFGKERSIRSDDYVVETPSKLASIADGKYSQYNEIARGTKTLNSINGVYLGYSTIGKNPFQFAYAILPAEYAYSFCWYAPILLCFLLAIEFFYMFSKRNALIALTGAALEILSTFYLWWGFPGFLLGAQGAVVCAYYFLYEKKYYKKWLWGAGVAVLFANYVLTLYPAWIVPMGFVIVCFLIGIIHDNWERVKRLKRGDWLIVGIAAIFAVSIIGYYFWLNQEYVYSITHTLYPGKRSEYGGGAITKLFYYAQSFLYAFKDLNNPSEGSMVFSLFPIPSILAIYSWFKNKKKDWTLTGLLIVDCILFLYVSVGLPPIIAKVFFLTNSTAHRTADIVGIIQIYLIIYLLSHLTQKKEIQRWMKIVLAVATTAISVIICHNVFPEFLTWKRALCSAVVVGTFSFALIYCRNVKVRNYVCYAFIIFSVATSFYIRPISRGFDAITQKPVSKEIQKILEDDADSKWITYGGSFLNAGFALANGAPTLNSTNTYPNLELWEKLDPKNEYEQIYNRYAHISFDFTDENTSFELISLDQVKVNLSYEDIQKTDAKYVLAFEPIELENEYVKFKQIYEEDGSFIYKIQYIDGEEK
ncbi:MAG: hypothetical protein PHW34_11955 [Hespellia sp.]|nr:hypothetical protein [Hespellia sp.]